MPKNRQIFTRRRWERSFPLGRWMLLVLLGGALILSCTFAAARPVFAQDVTMDPDTDYVIRDGRIIFFSDISTHWAFEPILDLREQGVIDGFPDGTFRPDASVTRAEFVTILANLTDSDLSRYAGVTSFSDVPIDEWYSPYVQWGWSYGLVSGYEVKKPSFYVPAYEFRPENPVSRQEAAALLARFVDGVGIKLEETRDEVAFQDSGEIAAYAAGAVKELQRAGIVSGVEEPKGSGRYVFEPRKAITRGETAVLISGLIGRIPPGSVFQPETVFQPGEE